MALEVGDKLFHYIRPENLCRQLHLSIFRIEKRLLEWFGVEGKQVNK